MLSLENTKNAFANRTDKELKKAYFVFKVLDVSWLNAIGTRLTMVALNLRLPVKGIIKWTVFDHFCGGETIEGCKPRVKSLYEYKVGTILDYSVEGDQNERAYENCLNQLLIGLILAEKEEAIPFCVVKLTGLIPFEILEKLDGKKTLTEKQKQAFERGKKRVYQIASAAKTANTPFMIDAEESWIQDTIDTIVFDLMLEFNKERALIYNTVQMYRHDRLEYIKELFVLSQKSKIHLGLKIVRGAYMEKEREKAKDKGYASPIQVDKASTDKDYNLALQFCSDHHENIAICCGTHNEASSLLLTDLMKQKNISKENNYFYFAQLLGMSDHISYNLSKEGYNVAKYVPYGRVKEVMPYLIRRANENTSVAGQTGRELSLIQRELERRKL
tara:strand:+ start:13457 stop:14620 length:1164 start_codon:yes stop_codon:yes gene_type:complete